MAGSTEDRDLLLGLLAVLIGLLDPQQLTAAVTSWTANRSGPLGDFLVQQGVLSAHDRMLLEPLVDRQIELHGGTATQTLTSLPSEYSLGNLFQRIGIHPNTELSATRLCDSSLPETIPVGDLTSEGGRFRILRPHAQGGLGKVSVAFDQELNREVALKEIRDSLSKDAHARVRFLAEAEITGRLEHPGVVPGYGLGQFDDGRPYYAMRLIRGESMQKAIAGYHTTFEKPGSAGEMDLALRSLLRRFIDICNAVEYAHSRGVLHRDLKPGNVMLGRYGETLVVDWGLAKVVESGETLNIDTEPRIVPGSGGSQDLTQMGAAVGTPQFMSPEQALGRLDLLGPKTDVYSLGATLLSLLTGKSPIDGQTRDEVLTKTTRGDFPSPRQVNPRVAPALEAICLKAMARRLDDRYDSPRAIVEDVERWLADEPVSAYREPLRGKLQRWTRHHRMAVAVVAALLVAASLALGIGNVLVRHERAYAIATQMRDANPYSIDPRKTLARIQIDFGEVLASLGNYPKALDMEQQAADTLCTRADNAPADIFSRLLSVFALNQLGRIAGLAGQLERAELALNQSVRRGRENLKLSPRDVNLRFTLAWALLEQATLLAEQGKQDAAKQTLDEPLRSLTELTTEQPSVASFQRHLAVAHTLRGQLALESKQLDDAISHAEQAVKALEQLNDNAHGAAIYRLPLIQAIHLRAQVHLANGEKGEASQDVGAAMQLGKIARTRNPSNPELTREIVELNLLRKQLQP